MDSGYLPLLAAQLAAAGFACVRFTCKPPHLPTRTAAFQAVLRAAATEWPETRGVRRWFVAGHSMRATKELKEAGGGEGSGSRGDCGGAAGPETARQEPKQARGAKRSKQASVARISDAAKRGEGAGAVSEAALPRVQGCVLLSYPLHPPDKPTELRDRPLVGLRLPVLFVRGSRDAFSLPEQQWEEVLGRMRQAGCDSLQRRLRWSTSN
eukprot:XP_001697859.1 predicted protein [Chlamydomonas reinhardtii]